MQVGLTIITQVFIRCIVLVAEVVKHFLPHLVELHNYSAAHSIQQKTYNWNTLNQKILKKLQFQLSPGDIKDLVEMVPETIERILFTLKYKINEYLKRKKQKKMDNNMQMPMQPYDYNIMPVPNQQNPQVMNEIQNQMPTTNHMQHPMQPAPMAMQQNVNPHMHL